MKLLAPMLGLTLSSGISPAGAQETGAQRNAPWTQQVGVGQFLRVETSDGVERAGKLVRIGPDSIHLVAGAVAIDQVIRVRVFERTRARQYAVVGAVVGALFFAKAGQELAGLDDSANPCRGLHCGALPGAAIGVLVGYGVGAAVGSIVNVWRTVKDSR